MDEFRLDDAEREEIACRLDVACSSTEAEIKLLPSTLWFERPELGSWSPAEIVEHVVLAQMAMESRIRGHLSDAPNSHSAVEMQARREQQGAKAQYCPLARTILHVPSANLEVTLGYSRFRVQSIKTRPRR